MIMLAWMLLWATGYIIYSKIFIVLLLISTSMIHHRLMLNYTPNNDPTPKHVTLFTHVPFSMLSAYSLFILIQKGSVNFIYENEWTAVVLVWIMALIGFAWCFNGIFSYGRRDLIFSATIACLLLGIGVEHVDHYEKRHSTACIVLSATQIAMILFNLVKNLEVFGGNGIGERSLLFPYTSNTYGTNSRY
ncbi:5452_t:CDS:2 [Acaulospora morrowiae]|uniref:5452_t:CDS:1 n=1 Tax=Acaulospora morrowiae TaxID=94023 RepID=A0A9N9GZ80_9GLOM|nr:5452_t:CDS:2 [Acaulospora morrowiae]